MVLRELLDDTDWKFEAVRLNRMGVSRLDRCDPSCLLLRLGLSSGDFLPLMLARREPVLRYQQSPRPSRMRLCDPNGLNENGRSPPQSEYDPQ